MEGVGPLVAPQCLCSNPKAQDPLPPTLIGEHLLLISKTTEGIAVVTNFRFCVCEKHVSINIPLLAVRELLVVEAAKRLRISCKDGSTYSCTFATGEDCQACISTLRGKTGPPQSPEDLFAYKFYAAATYKQSSKTSLTTFEKEMVTLCQPVSPDFAYSLDKEVQRLGFDMSGQRVWRISQANANFELCPTYPKCHILPAAVDDDTLKVSLDFRALKRFPSVVWRDKRTGMVLIRSSQPLSSFLGVSYFTNHADVFLIDEIVRACDRDWLTIILEKQRKPIRVLPEAEVSSNCGQENGQRVSSPTNSVKDGGTPGSLIGYSSAVAPGQGTSNGTSACGDSFLPRKLAIVDCRSLAGVWGNSFKGGGTEDEAVYKCNIVHLDLANIHTVRDSFHKLRAVCHAYAEGMFFKSLTGCMWLSYISALLRGANIVVELMHVMKRPVLVHCSDGWDRTSQIVSLSELMLDPYYRTLEGFQVLVEREWLHFGHKFGERGGHDPNCCDTNQMSPIFLQFLDCVHQLTLQYPTEFQFNEAYLVKLLQHSQACLFGNFLHNCQRERENCQQKTASVWSLLKPERVQFVNLLYKQSDQVLTAKSSEHNMVLWKSVYMPGLSPLPHVNHTDFYQDFKPPADGEGLTAGTDGMPGPKSMDDLPEVTVDGSDYSISESPDIAAAAPSMDGLHIESSASELMLFPEDSPQIASKASLSGKSEENFQDPPWKIDTGKSASCEHSYCSRGSLSTAPRSDLDTSATQGVQEDHAITLRDTTDDAFLNSSQQICLNELSCDAPSADDAFQNSSQQIYLNELNCETPYADDAFLNSSQQICLNELNCDAPSADDAFLNSSQQICLNELNCDALSADDAFLNSSQQICLNELSCEAPPADEARNIKPINDNISADDYAAPSLLSTSPGFLSQKDFTGSFHEHKLHCDKPINSNYQVLSSENKALDIVTFCPIVRSQSLDNVSAVASFSQISRSSNNKSISSVYNTKESSLLLEHWTLLTGSDVSQIDCIKNIDFTNMVNRMRHLNNESSLISVKSDSNDVLNDHTRRSEFYRKLGINSNYLVNTYSDRAKTHTEPRLEDFVGSSCVNGGIFQFLDSTELSRGFDSTELSGGFDARTNTIAAAATSSVDEMKIHSKPLEAGTQHDGALLRRGDDHPPDGTVIHQFSASDDRSPDGTVIPQSSASDDHPPNGTVIHKSSARDDRPPDGTVIPQSSANDDRPPDGTVIPQSSANDDLPPDGTVIPQSSANDDLPPDGTVIPQSSASNDLPPDGTVIPQSSASDDRSPDGTVIHKSSASDDSPPDGTVIPQSSNAILHLARAASGASPPDSSVSQCPCCCHWSGASHKGLASEGEVVSRKLLLETVSRTTADISDSHIVQAAEPDRRELSSADVPRDTDVLGDPVSDVSWETWGEPEATLEVGRAGKHCVLCDSEFSLYQQEDLCWAGKMICKTCCSPDQEKINFLKSRVCLRCCSQNLHLSPGASSDGRIPTLVADG